MSPIAIILIIASAIMHASWNFVSKRRDPSLAFFWITAVCASIIMSPFLIAYRHALPLIPTSVWGLLLATGIAQAVYFFGLAGAYRQGDISLAYPLARAIPVLLVALISILVGRGGEIGRLGFLGMMLIFLGCVVLPLPHFGTVRLRDYFDIVYLLAVVAALGTVAYTLLDDQALRSLRASPVLQLSILEITLLFISLQAISTALMMGTATLFVTAERHHAKEILHNRSAIVTAATTGVVIMTAYGLVLASLAFVSNVSYAAAFRQLSIPIGALLGMTVQREPRYRPKIVGIGVVTVGLVLVAIG